MPFIHIRSLPQDPSVDISAVSEALSRDLSQETDTDLRHLTTTWEYLPPDTTPSPGWRVALSPRRHIRSWSSCWPPTSTLPAASILHLAWGQGPRRDDHPQRPPHCLGCPFHNRAEKSGSMVFCSSPPCPDASRNCSNYCRTTPSKRFCHLKNW